MRVMSNLIRNISAILLPVALAAGAYALAAPPSSGPPKEPAKIEITVSPDAVSPGDSAEVTLRLTPKSGIEINRYPKIKLTVPEQDGLGGEAEVSIGDDAPPPPDHKGGNYFETVDPVKLEIDLAAGAKRGEHEFDGRLVYFYCVKKSGFCAPARVNVKIPVTVQ
jgi:hypothetical protein